MSEFCNSDLLEEIVETTEGQESEYCSIGENVNDSPNIVENIVLGEIVQQNKIALSNKSSNRVYSTSGSRNYMEQEKRIRREIANSNERRRMQSINAGFQSLRSLLPHHEGEKLSKAAILQQTAEYIYQLEQQKTQLLSQNLQLKRLVDQQENNDVPKKKRKGENKGVAMKLTNVLVHESSDEGLESMSPEPFPLKNVSPSENQSTEITELRRQLERERSSRIHLEKQILLIQNQVYSEKLKENQLVSYDTREVHEHASIPSQELELVSVLSVPQIGLTQTVDTNNSESNTPPLSPQIAEVIIPEEEVIKDEFLDCQAGSPKILSFTHVQVFENLDDQISADESSETNNNPQKLPSVLEAAINAKPKVEVERLPSPVNCLEDGTPQAARLYLANTSRQNLETIVEAIRHLEGDHLFGDEPLQEVPLALTTANINSTKGNKQNDEQKLLHQDVNNIFQIHAISQQTQQRPGVIVVKHA